MRTALRPALRPALILLVLTAALLIAGCTSPTPTTNQTTGTAATAYPSLSPSTLNAQLATNTTPLENFTLVPDSSPPTYTATAQDENGTTLHSITLILASSLEGAQGQFEAQKASYADYAAQPNATVTANSSTNWAVTTGTNAVSVWVGAPGTAGPFGLNLDASYVVVSMDTKPPTR